MENIPLATQLVIFDCDGVLVDSELLSYRIYAEEFAHIGLRKTPEELLKSWSGFSLDAMIKATEEISEKSITPDFKQQLNDHVFASFSNELRPMAGIKDLLNCLRTKGYQFCVVSNGEQARINKALLTTELDLFFPENRRFNVLMVKNGKPAPDLLLFAAQTIGVTPDKCLVIEDSVTGIHAAQAAHMPVVGFLAGEHAQSNWYQKRIYATKAAFFAHSSSELCSLFKCSQI